MLAGCKQMELSYTANTIQNGTATLQHGNTSRSLDLPGSTQAVSCGVGHKYGSDSRYYLCTAPDRVPLYKPEQSH